MANNNAHKIAQVRVNFRSRQPRVMSDIAKIAYEFFRSNFKKEGFNDGRFKKWPAKKFNFSGPRRQTLRNSGKLFEGIRMWSGRQKAVVFNKVKYAQTHNEGAEITVTPQMRRFFWAKHMQAKAAGNAVDADIWKNMALKKGSTIKIPKRPILYKSSALEKKIEKYIRKFIKSL